MRLRARGPTAAGASGYKRTYRQFLSIQQ